MVDRLCSMLASGPNRQRTGAGKGNFADLAQIVGRQKPKEALIRRKCQNGYFVALHSEMLADQLNGVIPRHMLCLSPAMGELGSPFLEFADVFACHWPKVLA